MGAPLLRHRSGQALSRTVRKGGRQRLGFLIQDFNPQKTRDRTGGPRKSLGRSLRNESSNHMAFPHPQSRKDHYRKEDKPNCGGVARKFFKRTIDITEYRNAKDEVNRAKNQTLGIHRCLRERGWCIVLRSRAVCWVVVQLQRKRAKRAIHVSQKTRHDARLAQILHWAKNACSG